MSLGWIIHHRRIILASVGMSFLFLMSLAAMLYLKWDLALLSTTPLILVTGVFILCGPRLHSYSLASQAQLGAISNRAQEHYFTYLVG